MDLIHICEHKLKLREVEILTNFSTDECDIWVPNLKLGIEIRNSWNEDSQAELINILNTTNSRLHARFLAVVCLRRSLQILLFMLFEKWNVIN